MGQERGTQAVMVQDMVALVQEQEVQESVCQVSPSLLAPPWESVQAPHSALAWHRPSSSTWGRWGGRTHHVGVTVAGGLLPPLLAGVLVTPGVTPGPALLEVLVVEAGGGGAGEGAAPGQAQPRRPALLGVLPRPLTGNLLGVLRAPAQLPLAGGDVGGGGQELPTGGQGGGEEGLAGGPGHSAALRHSLHQPPMVNDGGMVRWAGGAGAELRGAVGRGAVTGGGAVEVGGATIHGHTGQPGGCWRSSGDVCCQWTRCSCGLSSL